MRGAALAAAAALALAACAPPPPAGPPPAADDPGWRPVASAAQFVNQVVDARLHPVGFDGPLRIYRPNGSMMGGPPGNWTWQAQKPCINNVCEQAAVLGRYVRFTGGDGVARIYRNGPAG